MQYSIALTQDANDYMFTACHGAHVLGSCRLTLQERERRAEIYFSGEMTRELTARAVEQMQALNVCHASFKAPRAFARHWRTIAYSLGLTEHRICAEIMLPPDPLCPEVDYVLTMLELPSGSSG